MTEQNIIRKTSIDKLGYNFIKSGYLPKGKERLRIVLHAFNTEEEVQQLIEELKT